MHHKHAHHFRSDAYFSTHLRSSIVLTCHVTNSCTASSISVVPPEKVINKAYEARIGEIFLKLLLLEIRNYPRLPYAGPFSKLPRPLFRRPPFLGHRLTPFSKFHSPPLKKGCIIYILRTGPICCPCTK